MKLALLAQKLDFFFQYQNYPDAIVDILREVDTHANEYFSTEYLCQYTGLMAKFGDEIRTIFCAAFPSDDLLVALKGHDATDALLIIKHPMDWQEIGIGFIPISSSLIETLKERRISLYCAHAVHDNHIDCAPSLEMARLLPYNITESMSDNNGRIFGYVVESKEEIDFISFRKTIALTFHLRGIQERYIHDQVRRIAVIAGGGDNIKWLQQAKARDCDTYLTGILFFQGSAYSKQHNPFFIKELKSSHINAIGISHYLSEKNGSIKLAELLNQEFGIPTRFLAESDKEQSIYNNWGHTI